MYELHEITDLHGNYRLPKIRNYLTVDRRKQKKDKENVIHCIYIKISGKHYVGLFAKVNNIILFVFVFSGRGEGGGVKIKLKISKTSVIFFIKLMHMFFDAFSSSY